MTYVKYWNKWNDMDKKIFFAHIIHCIFQVIKEAALSPVGLLSEWVLMKSMRKSKIHLHPEFSEVPLNAERVETRKNFLFPLDHLPLMWKKTKRNFSIVSIGHFDFAFFNFNQRDSLPSFFSWFQPGLKHLHYCYLFLCISLKFILFPIVAKLIC